MFIRLHHKISGKEFFIPASHVVIIDGVTTPNKVDVRAPGDEVTHIHTVIMKGQNTLTFEVRESPEEVATLVNEMLNSVARATRMN
jgi:phosphate uptake regulator